MKKIKMRENNRVTMNHQEEGGEEKTPNIDFSIGGENLLTISENGFEFNRDHSICKSADDFALKFCSILEDNFTIKIEETKDV